MLSIIKSCALAGLALAAPVAAKTTWKDLKVQRESYTYSSYLEEFSKLNDPARQPGTDSYEQHKAIFDAALQVRLYRLRVLYQ